MESARTTSSAAAAAAPASAKCRTVTLGDRAGGGAGRWEGARTRAGARGGGARGDPGTPGKVQADGTRSVRARLALGRQRRR